MWLIDSLVCYASFDFRFRLLAFDGVSAVPEGYCCAGSPLFFLFRPAVYSGCPEGVGLFLRILAVDIESFVGCRVLAFHCEDACEVLFYSAADTLIDLCVGGDRNRILWYSRHIESVCCEKFTDGHFL